MAVRPGISHAATPKFGMRFLGWLLPWVEREETKGDLEERFQLRVQERGAAAGRVWFWIQVLHLILYLVKDHVLWSCIMFKNNMVIAWRNIKKYKAYSALNILGLAVGMAVFILIMLYVRYEFSYDRYHANAKNIYRVIQKQPGNMLDGSDILPGTPPPLAPALVQNFPEVLSATRITSSSNVLLRVGEKTFVEERLHWADPQTFDIFSFPFVRVAGASALKDPYSIVLSERASRRLFGDADPINRTIVYQAALKNFNFKVAGVFRDIPPNSHFVMDIVASFDTFAKFFKQPDYLSNWGQNHHYTYLQLREGTEARALENKFPAFVDKLAGNTNKRYFLQSLARVHLFSSGIWTIWADELSPTGDLRLLFLSSSMAVLVLIIACVNYMNLETARSLKRVKEIGLRKVVGAGPGQIARQFLGHSLVFSFLGLSLAVAIVLVVLPAFRSFTEREVVFNPLRDTALIPALILLAAFVGIISGSYPAFFVSACRPVPALKGASSSRSRRHWLRNSLIVFQFATSIALMICTIGITSQLRYIRNKDMGFKRDQILVLSPTREMGMRNSVEAFITELKRNPAVLRVSVSSYLPNLVRDVLLVPAAGISGPATTAIKHLSADYDYVDLFGLNVIQGRNFSREFPSDASEAILINETAQKVLGLTEPVGSDVSGKKIIGVVKDFHMQSLRFPIEPVFIFLDPRRAKFVSLLIQGERIPATLSLVSETWKRFEPNYPFEFSFFDEIYNRVYRAERRLEKIFRASAGLAVFIACLGLVGLASLTAEQKTKEVGIRKVLGASTSGVIALLSREFMTWVVLANLIAWPIGYFALRSWLSRFAYRTNPTVPMFLGAGLAAFLIAAAVISLQTHRTAAANPVDALRFE